MGHHGHDRGDHLLMAASSGREEEKEARMAALRLKIREFQKRQIKLEERKKERELEMARAWREKVEDGRTPLEDQGVSEAADQVGGAEERARAGDGTRLAREGGGGQDHEGAGAAAPPGTNEARAKL